MQQPLVSVVVPIYNVEKFLNRCLESIVNQSYNNIEIILVDDGSPDNCPQMCEDWVKKDSRIKAIHKENGGLGEARNTGMKAASGDYFCFIDSDDYVDRAMIEECVSVAMENKADAVFFGGDYITPDGKVVGVRNPNPPKNVFSGAEVKEILLPMALTPNAATGENWHLSLSACCGLFSSEIIKKHGWHFVSERQIIAEDYYSVCELYQYFQTVCIVGKPFYHYIQNENSLTHTYREDRYEKICYFAEEMFKLSKNIGCGEILELSIKTVFLRFVMGALKQIAAAPDSFKVKYRNLKSVICDKYLQNIIHSYNYSGENAKKKILFSFMKKRLVLLSFFIVSLRNMEKR